MICFVKTKKDIKGTKKKQVIIHVVKYNKNHKEVYAYDSKTIYKRI